MRLHEKVKKIRMGRVELRDRAGLIIYFPRATESGQPKAASPQRSRKPVFLYGGALRAKGGRKNPRRQRP